MAANSNYQMGRLFSRVDALDLDIKEIKQDIKGIRTSIDSLLIWKAQVWAGCSLLSVVASGIFYVLSAMFR